MTSEQYIHTTVVFVTNVNVFKQLFIYKVYVLIIDVQNMS